MQKSRITMGLRTNLAWKNLDVDEFVDEKSSDLNKLLRPEDCKYLKRKVGARGFEPPASWSRTRRSSQAEPRPGENPNSLTRQGPYFLP
jgi:hypothetical protein